MLQDWNHYRFFLQLAQHGTLKAASSAMGVSLSTVFRRINTLEEELGVRLFDRNAGGFTLTSEGTIMLAHVQSMETEALNLQRQIAGKDNQTEGSIRLSTSDSVFHFWLAPKLKSFNQAYPKIQVQLNITPKKVSLERHEVDLVISVGNSRPDYMIGKPFKDVHYYVYAHKDRNISSVQDPQELLQHPIIHLAQNLGGSPIYQWMLDLLGNQSPHFHSDQFSTQYRLIKNDLGIGILPDYVSHLSSEIESVFKLPDHCKRQLWLLTHPDLRHNSRVKAFMQHISQVSDV